MEKTVTTNEKVPVCQGCGKFGVFPLSGICDECEIEEIEREMEGNWIEPTDMGAQ